jgi:ribulose-5-phosphate 4-epimerase/fuculose-1-phosphate aldolase
MPTSAAAAPGATYNANDPVWQAKVHLAAALRLAVLHDFDEGIDNHFTVAVPGREDQYLISPFGVHWSEARASTMMVFNEAGETLEGEGVVELSAQSIHAPVHRLTGAKVVLHTHQPRP